MASSISQSQALRSMLNNVMHRTRFVIAASVKLRSHSLPPPPRFVLTVSIPSLRSPMSSMASPQATSDASQPSIKTVRVVVKGRVQGVFYRNWTVENAKQLDLNGWVRNRRDGSVEALFSGNPDSVNEMEQRCRRGPPSAVVTGLDVSPCNDDPGPGFELKQTA